MSKKQTTTMSDVTDDNKYLSVKGNSYKLSCPYCGQNIRHTTKEAPFIICGYCGEIYASESYENYPMKRNRKYIMAMARSRARELGCVDNNKDRQIVWEYVMSLIAKDLGIEGN